ncbi:MAG TPA: hypothetical protein VI756_32235, partial [Blastocatellia bacterium]
LARSPMRKLLLTLCFILAVPIFLSGFQNSPGVMPSRAYACEELPGNCVEYKPAHPSKSDGKSNGSGEMGFPIQEIGSGLAMLAPVFMIWLGLRR